MVAALLLAACDTYVEGNGVFRDEVRAVAAFDAVSVSDGVRAVITAGAPEQRVTVSGDENVVQHVATRVAHDPVRAVTFLEVWVDAKRFSSKHPLQVNVAVPTLRFARARDGSPFKASGVASAAFGVEASSGSDVTLAGPAAAADRALAVTLVEGAFLDADAYPVSTAEVALDGGAWAKLRASVAVTGTVKGGSRLERSGTATCTGVAVDGTSTLVCDP